MFADDIILIDWNLFVNGKENVLNTNKDIFSNVDTIKIKQLNSYSDTVCCEIIIIINNLEKIQVIDVITFNNQLKIEKIKAYKIW